MHGLEGWKHLETAVVPGIYEPELADEMIQVGTEEAYEIIKSTAHTEGLLLSPSSAANLAGAIRVAKIINLFNTQNLLSNLIVLLASKPFGN